MVIHIARKELKTMFSSPMGWIILGIVQMVIGSYYTLSFNQYFEIMASTNMQIERVGMTEFICEGIFGVANLIIFFLVPLISMNAISEERKRQTMTFLLSAPISLTEIVCGKFIGMMTYLSLIIFSMLIMVFALNLWTEIDIGFLLSNVLGLWLLTASACAMGLFFSSLTTQPILAGFFTLISLSIFLLLDKFFTDNIESFFQYFSMIEHYKHFSQGMINSHDMTYFMLFSAIFILLTIRKLNADRLYG